MDNSSKLYTVQSGDTLYELANQFKTSVQKLKDINRLETNYLYVGQKLKLPQAKVIQATASLNEKTKVKISQEELKLLTRAVYSEARGEPYSGQVAVAAVILNRVEHAGFPDTIRGVIFEPWAFTAVHNGQYWLNPNKTARKAALDAVKGWDPTGGAIFYYNPAKVTSNWIYTREVVKKIGDHYFAI
nr:cell wall hydrolase [Halobacteroides halobius]